MVVMSKNLRSSIRVLSSAIFSFLSAAMEGLAAGGLFGGCSRIVPEPHVLGDEAGEEAAGVF